MLHPGRFPWNLQITHLERKIIFQTSMTMFHVNLPGCISFSGHHVSRIFHLQNFDGKVAPEKDLAEKLQQQQMDLDALSGVIGKKIS